MWAYLRGPFPGVPLCARTLLRDWSWCVPHGTHVNVTISANTGVYGYPGSSNVVGIASCGSTPRGAIQAQALITPPLHPLQVQEMQARTVH